MKRTRFLPRCIECRAV